MATIKKELYTKARTRLTDRLRDLEKDIKRKNPRQGLQPNEAKVLYKMLKSRLDALPTLGFRGPNKIRNVKISREQESIIKEVLAGKAPRAADLIPKRITTADPTYLTYKDSRLRTKIRENMKKGNTVEVKKLQGQLDLVRSRRGNRRKTNPNAQGYIYKIVDTKTNKVYIGQTLKAVQTRFREHVNASGSKFDKVLSPKNASRFKVTTLVKAKQVELDRLEAKYITKYNSIAKGYNTKLGNVAKLKNFNLAKLKTKVARKLSVTPARRRSAAILALRGSTTIKLAGKIVTSSDAARIMKKLSTKRSGKIKFNSVGQRIR